MSVGKYAHLRRDREQDCPKVLGILWRIVSKYIFKV